MFGLPALPLYAQRAGMQSVKNYRLIELISSPKHEAERAARAP